MSTVNNPQYLTNGEQFCVTAAKCCLLWRQRHVLTSFEQRHIASRQAARVGWPTGPPRPR